MLAYLRGRDTTIEVPDDIGDKELADIQNNLPHFTGGDEVGAAAPAEMPASEPAQAGGQKWVPNFFQGYIWPKFKEHLMAVDTAQREADTALATDPRGQAFSGKALEGISFGATRTAGDKLFENAYQEHPVFANAGKLTGELGALLATDGLLKIAGLGTKALAASEALPAIGAEGTVLAKATSMAPRFLPRAIMTGATFGTKRFIENTVKSFQDGQVDLPEFGYSVAKDTALGGVLGTVSGLSNATAAVSAATGLGYLNSRMEGGDHRDSLFNGLLWGAFELVGSFGGRNAALTRQVMEETVPRSIGDYIHEKSPNIPRATADGIGKAIVEQEAAKLGGAQAMVKQENALQILENINQKIRQGKVPGITEATTKLGGPEPTSPEPGFHLQPDVEALQAGQKIERKPAAQIEPPSTTLALPGPAESSAVRARIQDEVFPLTEVSSPPSISQHPDFIKMSGDATHIVTKYALERGVPPTPALAKSLFGEFHDALGEIMRAPADKRVEVANRIKAQYPDIEKEFATLHSKLYSDINESYFTKYVAGNYQAMKPPVNVEAISQPDVPRGTKPQPVEKPVKYDDRGIPVRRPGSVVSTIELPDGQKAKISHKMILDEAQGMLDTAKERHDVQDSLGQFVKSNGGIKGFKNGAEAEEFSKVPVRFRGITAPDEMAQMAFEAGLISDPSSDELRDRLASIPIKGAKPKLADFYDEAQRNLEEYFSSIGGNERAMASEKGSNYVARQSAYHGSPYHFDKFSIDKIGSGEGNQAYGWGLYFAGAKDVAEYYRKVLTPEPEIPAGVRLALGKLDYLGFTFPGDAIRSMRIEAKAGNDWKDLWDVKPERSEKEAQAAKVIDDYLKKPIDKGALYHVEIPEPDEYLDWDEELKEQSPKVKAAVEKIMKDFPDQAALKLTPFKLVSGTTGADLYLNLEQFLGDDAKKASIFIEKHGIPGIKYLDQNSRGKGDSIGTHNYVIFNDKLTTISKVEEKANPYQQELALTPYTEPLPTEKPDLKNGFRSIKEPHLKIKFREIGHVFIPNQKVASPADVAFAFKQFSNPAAENFYLMALKKGKIVAIEHQGMGTIDQVAVYPANILHLMDKTKCDEIAVCHNHPSGHIEPSEEDRRLTRSIVKVAKNHGVKFYGHVIIDDTKFGFIGSDGQVSTETHAQYAETKKLPVLQKYFEWAAPRGEAGVLLSSPTKAFELMKGVQLDANKEALLWLTNVQNEVTNSVIVSHKNLNMKTLQKIAAAYRPGGIIMANSKLDAETLRAFKSDLAMIDVRLMDNIEIEGDGYKSSVERGVFEKSAEYQPDLFKPNTENVAVRYDRLAQQALDQGLTPPEAKKFAQKKLAQGHNVSVEQKPQQAEFGAAGGVEGFGQGRQGESEFLLKEASSEFGEIKNEIKDLINPSSAAPLAAAITRENLGKMARAYDRAELALKDASEFFDAQPAAFNVDFIDRMERGEKQPTPELEQIASTLRKILDQKRQEVQDLGTGKLANFIENYFPHIWEQGEKTVDSRVRKAGKRPLEGSKSFLKSRKIEFFKKGIELGLRPVSYNPIELTLLKSRDMDKYIMAHRTLESLKDEGLSKFVRLGQDIPEGFKKIDDKVSTVMHKTDEGMVITGHWYTQEDAARIINNYLSPGLNRSAAFRAYRTLGNAINQFQLGFSAFHLGFTSVDAMVSKLALAINELAAGHPISAVKTSLHVPFAAVENVVRGDKMLKAWREGGKNSTDEILAEAMAVAGGRARMDQFYSLGFHDQLKKYFQEGSYVKGLLHIPLAITDLASKPILEYIVPRQKLGVFADIMQSELNRNVDMTHEEIRDTAQKAWDSVDNRMGQLVYDNLFWSKTFKDLLMASVRSVGWNLGTIREIVGGAKDIAEIIANTAKGKKSETSYRAAYFIALPILTGILGAIYQYLRTGEGPKELKDYFFPRTGNVDKNGDPERRALPSYMKDLYHYQSAPLKTVMNKLSPIIAMMGQMYDNKDFYGTKIRNEDDPFVQQVFQEGAYIAKQMIPFGVRNAQKNRQAQDKSVLDMIEPFIGITPAPYDVNQTEAEHIAHRIAMQKIAIGGRTQAQTDRSNLLRDFSNRLRKKDKTVTKDMMKAFMDGKISSYQMADVMRSTSMTPLQRLVHSFTAEEINAVYAAATPAERKEIQAIVTSKNARSRAGFAPVKTPN